MLIVVRELITQNPRECALFSSLILSSLDYGKKGFRSVVECTPP